MQKDIYQGGVWPKDFLQSVLVPLEKKKNAFRCEDFRTISLISHASKVVLRILARRLEKKSEEYMGNDQFGFRKERGTRDAIGVVRCLAERRMEFNEDMFVCFVDYEKAFDRVNWKKLMEVLIRIGVDWRDRRLIASLYMEQSAVVRVNDEVTESSEIGRGVRQGCLISPLLFNIYAEAMMREALYDVEDGVKVGGEVLNAVRFADDQAMIAGTEEGLQRIMDNTVRVVESYGMKINTKKTKVMRISRVPSAVSLMIQGIQIEQVDEFKY